ncbi:immunity 52 family protein [Archangium violaceum]|uniref:Imm52 family immunity protein n=1 Tax=Archangium violaceum TaxID=83451 RepID=UPI00195289D8|nr:Imm52 family immunity protein [Archangium violaceum]QRN93742.1 immunity 52 family protein [Archangium violaceum]
MQESYYVGAYWGPRKETALECARRAELFFHMLARSDPSFAQWYRAGRGFPRELPGHPVHPEVKELEKLLLRSKLRTDVDKEVIEDMGFRQMVWNAKKEATEINLYCGKHSPWGGPNSCLLKPTREGAIRERLLRTPVLAEVLTSMATAWDPDFAMASSDEMVSLVQKRKWEVRVGWLTYLSRRLGTVPPLPAPVRIEPVGELGWLLVLSPEPMTASNPEHVAFTARVRELLDRAGLIARPEPKPTEE